MNRTLCLLLIAATATSGFAQEKTKQDKVKPKPAKKKVEGPPPTYPDVSYGSHPRQRIDFWKVDGPNPAPVILCIHGGGWVNGDKSGYRNGAKRYLDKGIAVAAINYRFIAQAEAEGVSPPVKAPLHDAARALQFIRSKAAEWNIDKKKIAATGGSAGACTSLWLAFHDDLADPKSSDPIARESTRLAFAAVNGAQTSLDPKQVREWMPNATYGGHAFGFQKKGDSRKSAFEQCLENRDKILPWIREYSPIELATKDDPPIYMTFPSQDKPAVIGETQKDPTHSAVAGIGLKAKLDSLGVEVHVNYPGSPDPEAKNEVEFIIKRLATKK